jgi:hypothetical protein
VNCKALPIAIISLCGKSLASCGLNNAPSALSPSGSARKISASAGLPVESTPAAINSVTACFVPCTVMTLQFFSFAITGSMLPRIPFG